MMEKLYVENPSEDSLNELTLYNNETFHTAYDIVNIDNVKYYRLPRYYFLNYPYEDLTTEGEEIDLDLLPTFHPRDKDQEDVINIMCSNNNGIIAARVGFGKTYTAIDAITRMKKKALIIVPNDVLMNQWITAIKTYTGSDDVGIIKGSKKQFDHPICIATTQTLSSRYDKQDVSFLKNMYAANFGVTFFDEGHITAAAPKFSKSIGCIYSKKIFVLLIDIPLDLGTYRRYIEWGAKDGIMQKYIKFLLKSEGYKSTLGSINDILQTYDRRTINLSSRIDMLTEIYENMKLKEHTSVVHAKTKKIFNVKTVLCTYGIGKNGLDIPIMDTLVYATPVTSKGALIQSIGRVIDRSSGHKKTIVVDINNSLYEVTNSMRNTRIRYYKDLGFKMINIETLEDFEKTVKYIQGV